MMKMKLVAGLVLAFMTTAGRAELSRIQEYWKMCDASAAVALDDQHFAAADDEGNTIRVYRRRQSAPVREFDVAKFLGTKKKAESDLEGAARIGNRVYWISSHGRDKAGKAAPDRMRFFATEVNGLELKPVGRVVRTLLSAVLVDPRFNKYNLHAASMLPPKEKDGLNIEGMVARSDGALLIGFRNPVPEGKALVLPLLNPAEVVDGAAPKLGEMIELDLGGRGVRDIANAGEKFLIIGGARDGRNEFGLFQWDPKLKAAPGLMEASFDVLNPEAIFRFGADAEGAYQVLSDDGALKIGSKDCKKLPVAQRRFRAAELSVTLK